MMTITLYYEQLEHTIVQVMHRAGATIDDRDVRFLAQLDDSLSDKQLIRRLIRTGIAKVKTLLREHLSNTTDTADDMLRENETSWSFSLDLGGDGQAMADLLHWFVVWRALRGIAPSLGLTALGAQADGEADDVELSIAEELLSLSMPIKERRVVTAPQEYSPIIEFVP